MRITFLVMTLAGLIPTVLAGCATGVSTWNRPGATQSEFARDRYACAQQSTGTQSSGHYIPGYGGRYDTGPVLNQGMYNACMEARGYTPSG
jgi:hypothetical protein